MELISSALAVVTSDNSANSLCTFPAITLLRKPLYKNMIMDYHFHFSFSSKVLLRLFKKRKLPNATNMKK